MFDKLFNLPKQLMQSYKRLPQMQKFVVLAVLGLVAWWFWKNYMATGMEGFAESGDVGTLTCTMYYVDWCPHCKNAKPEWEKLMQALHGKVINGRKILITKVDCEKFPEIAKQQNITGYPMFKFDLDGRLLDFQGERTFDAFKRYIETVAYSDFQ
jgi:thiol-disulfide isomerase/thioredoxin